MAKKRANGEGSIRKRKDGHWEGRYFYSHSGTGMSVYAEDDNYEEETVSINGCHGDFYRPTVENESSMLVWFDEDNGITFSIGGFLDKSDLLKMAKSVEKVR